MSHRSRCAARPFSWIVACSVVTARAALAAAPAEFPSVRLEWSGPKECTVGADLAAAVSRQLGRPAFSPAGDSDLVLRGRIVAGANGRHRGELALFTRTGDPLGERTIESDNRDCRSLDDALAVMLAIMLNVRRADIRSLHEVSPWSFRGSVTGGLVFGLLPRPGFEMLAASGVVYDRRWGFDLELAYATAARERAAEGAVSAQAAAARVATSIALLEGDKELRFRIVGGAGPMWASGASFPRVSQQTRLYVEARAGLQWSLRVVASLWTQIGGDLGWIPLRPDFAVASPDGTLETLFRPGPMVGSFVAGFAFRTD